MSCRSRNWIKIVEIDRIESPKKIGTYICRRGSMWDTKLGTVRKNIPKKLSTSTGLACWHQRPPRRTQSGSALRWQDQVNWIGSFLKQEMEKSSNLLDHSKSGKTKGLFWSTTILSIIQVQEEKINHQLTVFLQAEKALGNRICSAKSMKQLWKYHSLQTTTVFTT